MSGGETHELSGRLLAFLDEGVAPVTAQEARARAGSRPNRRIALHWNPRRNRLVLAGAFGLALAVGLFALVALTGNRHISSPTKPPGHQLFVARLVPRVNATSMQLDRASAVVLRRLHLLGQSDAHTNVSGGGIVITTSKDVSMVRSVLAGVLAPGNLLFRPVLCASAPYSPLKASNGTRASPSGPLPANCPSPNQLTAANLNVSTNTGLPQGNVSPWDALANYPSTTSAGDFAARPVLLPAGTNNGFGDERLLLGPAELSGLDVSSAQLAYNAPSWDVNLTLDPAGSTAWDVLAERQFHAYVAFDLDANLVSVPLTEPSQAAFANFGGKVQISGDFTHTTANELAIDLESGPLPVALRAVGSAGG